MYKLDYNPVSKRWQDRMDGLPEEIKRQIDTPIGKENLKVLRRIRKIDVKEGDIFVCSMNGNVFYYGKTDNDTFSLISTNYKLDKPNLELPTLRVLQIDRIQPGNTTKSLRTLSSLRRDLTNETTRILLDDWGVEFSESDKKLFTTDYVKNLSWIEIRKKVQ